MNEKIQLIDKLKAQAFLARALYKNGTIDRDEAKEKINPYIEMYNKRVVEIAKKYNQKPKKINIIGFLRG